MPERNTHWTIILFCATLLGLTLWLLGFVNSVPSADVSAELDMAAVGRARPGTQPASRKPRLPSAGQTPLVIGDQAPKPNKPAVRPDSLVFPPSANAESYPSTDDIDTEADDFEIVSDNRYTKPALAAPAVANNFSSEPVLAPQQIKLPGDGESAATQGRIADAVAQRADLEIRRGMELAERRAFFSGRAAIIKALRLIAEAQDAVAGGVQHSQALAAGLRALEESDAFIAANGELEGDLNVRAIVAGHRTPVVRERGNTQISPLKARREYYTFAQEQLALAVEGEPVGSMALFGLGKMHTVLAEQKSVIVPGTESKALVFHQAAIMVSPNNPLACNELGVLLARGGRLEEAREWLIHSARISALPETWHNLSVVHGQLGEDQLAEAARQESQLASRGKPLARAGENRPDVKWVDAKVFAEQNPNMDENMPAAPSAAQAPGKPRQSSAPIQRSRK
ncbi:MAG: hypothetical protein AB7O62_10295 [Pirellulales bacterium]